MSSPESTPTLELDEPVVGNYFVATYPPFYYWSAGEVPAAVRLLDAEPCSPPPPLGLYVHVPFCVERCPYCLYLAHDDRPQAKQGYVDLLVRELARWLERPGLAGRALDFVYFGGGTPSLLGDAQLERLLAGLQGVAGWQGAREVTFECAPRSVTRSKLAALRAAGVTRVSLGVQELDDEVLERTGRVHQVRDVERAWGAISAPGFTVRNIDLMAGLVGQTDASFDRSLERVIQMEPESVTIYQLEVPRNTPLYRSVQAGEVAEISSWEIKRARVGRAFARLEAAGYTVRSAYAAIRDPDRHAFVYQDAQYHGADLLGVGVASFSHVRGAGLQNVTALDAYGGHVDGGRLPTERAHVLGAEERLIRDVILQLKLGRVDGADIVARHGVEPGKRFAPIVERLASAGWLEVRGRDLVLTRAGLLRADRLLRLFYRDEHRGERYS